MTAAKLHALGGTTARVPATPVAIERTLARFHQRDRPRLARLAARHPRLADLAATFPGLLFALAVPRRGFDPEHPIDLAIHGAPLKAVAAAARVPMWVRRLQPEAFNAYLGTLPDGEDFRRRISNCLPRSPKLAPIWLGAVRDAARWGHDELAVWTARELLRDRKRVRLKRLRLLALYTWFSRPTNVTGYRLIRKAWQPAMRFATALEWAEEWRMSVALYLNIGEKPMDAWLEPCVVNGLEFVPLCSGGDIEVEAREMRNCLNSYGYALAHNRQRLWSIRHDGVRVATLSVGRYRGPIIDVMQLKGPANVAVPKNIWVTVRRWIDQHDLMTIEPRTIEWDKAPLDRRTWTDLWRPYWLAKRHIPDWLPLAPSRHALDNL
jgi:hypothetical protein